MYAGWAWVSLTLVWSAWNISNQLTMFVPGMCVPKAYQQQTRQCTWQIVYERKYYTCSRAVAQMQTNQALPCTIMWAHVRSCELGWHHVSSCKIMWGHVTSCELMGIFTVQCIVGQFLYLQQFNSLRYSSGNHCLKKNLQTISWKFKINWCIL